MTYEDALYLVIGVEDGWISVNKQTWEDYLVAKSVVASAKAEGKK